MLHPHTIGVGLSSPPILLLLTSWRSLCWSLKRDTLLKMATCVVTETIWNRPSLTTRFLAVGPPFLPPHDASCQLVDEIVTLYLEAPRAFHR